jgi:hypothetical protein
MCVVPSISTGSVMTGRGDLGWMVGTIDATPRIRNVRVSFPGLLLAATIALRNEPTPLSSELETLNSAPGLLRHQKIDQITPKPRRRSFEFITGQVDRSPWMSNEVELRHSVDATGGPACARDLPEGFWLRPPRSGPWTGQPIEPSVSRRCQFHGLPFAGDRRRHGDLLAAPGFRPDRTSD